MAGRRIIGKAAERAPALSATATAVNYFASGASKSNLRFTSSGCSLYDCALGGGYVLGRVVNIVGDKSSGKTLLAMEATANFARDYPNGWIRYAEAEAAFDQEYAAALGIPVDRIIFNDPDKMIATVEDLYEDLKWHLEKFSDRPGMYIIDSLDALSDEAELGREFDAGTYGGTKPKQIGQLFRRLVAKLERQGVTFIVISQLRDKLNVTFGETKTRSGGRALDFYASHIVWLAELGKLKRTFRGQERVVGLEVEAHVKKNKVGPAFRKARYTLLFGYGIDDMSASADFLCDVGREKLLHDIGMKKAASTRAKTRADADDARSKAAATPKSAALPSYKDVIAELRDNGGPQARELNDKLATLVRQEWAIIEQEFLPKSTKY